MACQPSFSTSQIPLKILIADDDARVRQALRAFIESDPDMGVAGEGCSTRDVLERDRTLHPSVVLLDLTEPHAQENLRLLRRLARIDKRAVVAMGLSGGLSRDALEAGAYAFVEKDGAPEALLVALHAATRNRR